MVRTLIAAIATMLLGCGAILSQIAITTALPVPSAGIPVGATELASPGLSSAP